MERPEPHLEIEPPSTPAGPYALTLSVMPGEKTVPYQGSGIPRPDGGASYGFQNVKRHPELLDTIPELASDPALRSIIAAIDRPETGLFSIACENRRIAGERGCRLSGYLEFALNCRERVTDAASYFRLFLELDRRLRCEGFCERVSFQWVICPTRFADTGIDGYTSEVRVDTGFHPDHRAAYECWRRALAALEAMLAGVPARSGAPIYTPEL